MEYKEMLKHAEWQKKRSKIMERDGWKCRVCDYNSDLRVHHLYYESGKKLWDYDDEALVTVCDKCHEKLHKDLAKLGGLIAFKALSNKLDLLDFING